MSKTSNVAVIGAGIMGTAIATRLLETGNRVRVFDLDADKVARLVEKGATAAESPATATAESNFVILSLNHANIVRSVVFERVALHKQHPQENPHRHVVHRSVRNCKNGRETRF